MEVEVEVERLTNDRNDFMNLCQPLGLFKVLQKQKRRGGEMVDGRGDRRMREEYGGRKRKRVLFGGIFGVFFETVSVATTILIRWRNNHLSLILPIHSFPMQ